MGYAHTVAGCTYRFDDLKTLLEAALSGDTSGVQSSAAALKAALRQDGA